MGRLSMTDDFLGSIEANAEPELVRGKRMFRGTFRVILLGREPIRGRTSETYETEVAAMSAAQAAGLVMAKRVRN